MRLRGSMAWLFGRRSRGGVRRWPRVRAGRTGLDDARGTRQRACCGSAGPRTPQTLNPFIGSDEENFSVWAINWDLLVNFSPNDLAPAPGLAEELGGLRRQEDGHLQARSRRQVVRRRADHLEGRQVLAREARQRQPLFTSYTSNVTSIDTPDAETVVIHTKQPGRADRRRPVHLHPPRAHLGQGAARRSSRSTYQPQLPLVGSGPYIVTEFERGRIIKMERNPNFRGRQPDFDEIQFIKYGNQDAVERALQLGEIDMVAEVAGRQLRAARREPNIETRHGPSPSFTQLAFNLCPEDICPDAKFNPAVQDRTSARRSPTRIDRERINEIAARGTSFAGHGILPVVLQVLLRDAGAATTRSTRTRRTRSSTTPAGSDKATASADEGRRRALVQPLRALGVAVRTSRRRSSSPSRRAEIGIEFNVQVVSVDKLTELTVRKVERQAGAGLRHVHLGLGRRSVRPELPAQHHHHGRDRRPLRLLLLEPRVRQALSTSRRDRSTPPSARRSSSRWSRPDPAATCPTSS